MRLPSIGAAYANPARQPDTTNARERKRQYRNDASRNPGSRAQPNSPSSEHTRSSG